MRMSLQYWDDTTGLDLQSTDFEAITLVGSGNGMAPATPNYIDLGTSDPIPGGKTLAGTLYTFHIKCKGTTDAALEVQRDTLNKWFRPNDSEFRKLVGYDVDNSNKDWYLLGTTISAPLLQPGALKNLYSVTIALKHPYWIEYDLQTDTWSITAASETNVISTSGNMPALPLFEITPITAKSSNGIAYKDFYAIHTSGYGGSFAVDITGGGLDTAALVAAGKMLASGNDAGVNINGVYVDKWVGGGGWNNASTLIWAVMKFTPFPVMTLHTALAGAGTPATLVVDYVYSGAILIAQNSTLQCGNELITFSSYVIDQSAKTITFTVASRNAKGSSIAAHSIGASVYWIENEVWLTYGNASATAPVVNDAKKPIIDLTASTNASWVYYLFGDSTGTRTNAPSLQGVVKPLNNYTGNHGANADPYTEAGIKLATTEFGGKVVSDSTLHVEWEFYHPGGISNFACNGEKYRLGAYFSNAAISSLPLKWGGGTIYSTIVSPSAAETWEAITINVAIADHSPAIFFGLHGSVGSSFPAPYSMAELDDVTQTNYDPPTVTRMGAQQENYKLGGYLMNNGTLDSILFLDLITKTNVTIYIDCDTKEIYSSDGKRLRGMIDFGGTKRNEWITLESGSNTLAFNDTGTVEINIVTKWRGRNTI